MYNKKLTFIWLNGPTFLNFVRLSMKKILLLFFFSAGIIANAQNKEFRATWVVTSQYISPSSTVEENKARIIKILEEHKRAHMNAVLWQVRQSGSAYYQSSYEPWGYYAGGAYPGFDPLAFVIQEAHKRGMEVHAWFNTFMISSNAADRVTALHPEWICTNGDGDAMTKYFALSPGIEAVRKYTLAVAMEIVNNYDIDGLHLDYIRWNEYDNTDMTSKKVDEYPFDGMISEEKLARLKSTEPTDRFIYDQYHPFSGGVPAGYSTWGDWRRDCVTDFVQMVHDSVQKVKPYVRLSVAALGKYKNGGDTGWNGYYVVFQDAAKWFNMGYIDQLTPMHYHWYLASAFVNALDTDWYPNITAGIEAKRLYTAGPGSYILEEYDAWNNHGAIVDSCRKRLWIDGFQFFSYGSWSDRDYWEEAGSTFFKRMTHVRSMTAGVAPPSPGISITKTDSLNYSITVTPAVTDKCWHVVYRSEDGIFNADSDDIIYTTFGNSQFTASDSFDGLQTFNGKYTYFATSFNRYWNESLPSDGVFTDSIPSIPPYVKSTVPVEGGRLPVNGSISFTFSKTMDTGSLEAALTIEPAAVCNESWSDDKRSVRISFQRILQYNTYYKVTLDHLLTDANGKKLDGNADGVPGDAFVLDFVTYPKDSTGPVLLQSTVSDGQKDIDIASVFSFTFNEVLLESSVSAASFTFRNSNDVNVPFKYKLYNTYDAKSVITIQPDALLDASEQYQLTIAGTVTDTLGNAAGDDKSFSFVTSGYGYYNIIQIDDFNLFSGWQTPTYSGSTTGVISADLSFTANSFYGLPASPSVTSARLIYSWDISAGSNLIREFLSSSSTQAGIAFDTTYALQVYIFGDSSNTKFRFCLDESDGSSWTDHEVSKWNVINWRGWKLVEWDLSDASSVGSWISTNNQMDGTKYRTDSFQFTIDDNKQSPAGTLYFDNYRAVKKVIKSDGIKDIEETDNFLLKVYPNPFTASATIQIDIKKKDFYSLTVYDLSGRIVEKLISSQLPEGVYYNPFGSNYGKGIYFIELRSSAGAKSIKAIRY
jgi:uncharacterized lipoprotein YddW (UPF0748 family)